jgi:ribosomal protein S18 acetylase RimI-like enzyme
MNNLYRLTQKDLEKAAVVLSNAFIDYPTFRYLFPKLAERQKKLRHVMTFFLNCGLHYGEVFSPSEKIEGVSIWYKSNALPIGLPGLLKAGLLKTILLINIPSFIRFSKLGKAKKANRDTLLNGEYYFLDLIGVDPSYARQGYAKLLIDTMLKKVDDENMSCFLETSSFKNVHYYQQYGFVLAGQYTYDGLESFCLIRN